MKNRCAKNVLLHTFMYAINRHGSGDKLVVLITGDYRSSQRLVVPVLHMGTMSACA